jgi:hypothetical protein
VDEKVKMAASANLNIFGNETRALGLEGFESRGDVLNVQRDVVEAFAAFREEAADGRVRRGGLEEFDARIAGGNERGANLLVLDGLLVDHFQAEGLVELARLVNAVDGDAEVVEFWHKNRV